MASFLLGTWWRSHTINNQVYTETTLKSSKYRLVRKQLPMWDHKKKNTWKLFIYALRRDRQNWQQYPLSSPLILYSHSIVIPSSDHFLFPICESVLFFCTTLWVYLPFYTLSRNSKNHLRRVSILSPSSTVSHGTNTMFLNYKRKQLKTLVAI